MKSIRTSVGVSIPTIGDSVGAWLVVILRQGEGITRPHIVLLREYEPERGIRSDRLPKPATAREIARWSREFGVQCAA